MEKMGGYYVKPMIVYPRNSKRYRKMPNFDENEYYFEMRDALDRNLPNSVLNGTAIGLSISAGFYLSVLGLGSGALPLIAMVLGGFIAGGISGFVHGYMKSKKEVVQSGRQNHDLRID
jgi:hypothetical protein